MEKDKNGWISVLDALPEFEQDVLLWWLNSKQKGQVCIGYLRSTTNTIKGIEPHFEVAEDDRFSQTFHFWQPVPDDPPEKK